MQSYRSYTKSKELFVFHGVIRHPAHGICAHVANCWTGVDLYISEYLFRVKEEKKYTSAKTLYDFE